MKFTDFKREAFRKGGNTSIALDEMVKIFEADGIEAEVVQVGTKPCAAASPAEPARRREKCVFDDVVNELAPKFEAAVYGLVIASLSTTVGQCDPDRACLDRLFYSTSFG